MSDTNANKSLNVPGVEVTPMGGKTDDLDARIAAAVGKALAPFAAQLQQVQQGAASQEAIDKAVAERVAANTAAQNERQALIDKVTKAKLGGNTKLGALLVGSTEDELNRHAASIWETFKASQPDFGVVRDSGFTPNDPRNDPEYYGSPTASSYISEGLKAAERHRHTAVKMDGNPAADAV